MQKDLGLFFLVKRKSIFSAGACAGHVLASSMPTSVKQEMSGSFAMLSLVPCLTSRQRILTDMLCYDPSLTPEGLLGSTQQVTALCPPPVFALQVRQKVVASQARQKLRFYLSRKQSI